MALAAVLAELSLVRIGVASGAGLIADPGELLEPGVIPGGYRVASGTGNFPVHPVERELCPAVVKQGGGLESILVVAVAAGGRKGILMVILVAGIAIRPEPQVCEFFASDRLVGNEFRLMTILAVLLCMGPFQVISGKTVVKAGGIEPDDLEIQPVMVVVAAYAAFAADRGG